MYLVAHAFQWRIWGFKGPLITTQCSQIHLFMCGKKQRGSQMMMHLVDLH